MKPPPTYATFCKATGWPIKEWLALEVPEAAEILAFYGLKPPETWTAIDKGYRAGYAAGYKAALDDVAEITGLSRG